MTNITQQEIIELAKEAGFTIRTHRDGTNPTVWEDIGGDITFKFKRLYNLIAARLAAPQQAIPSEQNMKRAIYENLMIAISHAKVAEDPFKFLSNQIEAMFNTEFSIRKRSAAPTAPIESDK